MAKMSKVSHNGIINVQEENKVAQGFVDALRTKTPSIQQAVGNLSGGNQQKVLLAKWMFADPDVLILDEPTRGIDVGAKYEIYGIMNDMLAQAESDPGKILTQMNDSMSEGNASDMFVTAFAGVLNLSTGELVYCNGGHNAPMIVGPKLGEAYFLDVIPNLPVCTIGGFDYVKQSIQLKPGTTIFVYTDGLTEAENEAKELYGEDRLETLMKHEGQKKPREVVEDVLNSVHAHVRDAEQSDDLTVLVIKYL